MCIADPLNVYIVSFELLSLLRSITSYHESGLRKVVAAHRAWEGPAGGLLFISV